MGKFAVCFPFACLYSLIPTQEFSQHHNITSTKLYYMHTAFFLFLKCATLTVFDTLSAFLVLVM